MAEEDELHRTTDCGTRGREAIYDLVKDYCNAIDDRDIDKYTSLMAEHVELCQFEGGNTRVGRHAVRDWMEWRFTQWGLSRHYPLNHRITVLNENDGKGIVNGWAEMAMDNRIYVTAIRYYDDYVRENGVWRFAVARPRCTTTRRRQICQRSTPTPYRKLFRGESDELVSASRRSAGVPGGRMDPAPQHEVPDANADMGEYKRSAVSPTATRSVRLFAGDAQLILTPR